VFSFSKEKKMPGKTIQGLPRSSPGQRLQKNLDRQSTGVSGGNQLSSPGQRLQQRFTKPVQMGTPQRPGLPTPSPTRTGVAPGTNAPPSTPRSIPKTPQAPGARGAKNPIVRTGIKKGVSVKTGLKGTGVPTLKSSPPPGGLTKVGGNGTQPKDKGVLRKRRVRRNRKLRRKQATAQIANSR